MGARVIVHLGGDARWLRIFLGEEPNLKRSILPTQHRTARTDNGKWPCGDGLSLISR